MNTIRIAVVLLSVLSLAGCSSLTVNVLCSRVSNAATCDADTGETSANVEAQGGAWVDVSPEVPLPVAVEIGPSSDVRTDTVEEIPAPESLP